MIDKEKKLTEIFEKHHYIGHGEIEKYVLESSWPDAICEILNSLSDEMDKEKILELAREKDFLVEEDGICFNAVAIPDLEEILNSLSDGEEELPPIAQRHVWHFRPKGFLEDNTEGFEKDRLDYIKELHQVIWKLLGVIGISWSGVLEDCVIRTLDTCITLPAPPEDTNGEE